MSGIHHELLGIGSGAGGGYTIDNSLRFDGSNDYLSRTPTASDRKKWTFSFWFKKPSNATANQQFILCAGTASTDVDAVKFNSTTDTFEFIRVIGGVTDAQKISSAVFRDPTAWYHCVVMLDAANLSAKLYVNGTECSYGTDNQPSNINGNVNNSVIHTVGALSYSISQYLPGYLSDIYFIDGQALLPTDFGETNADGVWVPIAYTGSYGNNGFHLDFADGTSTTTLGYDAAGSNDWTLTNMTRAAGVSECWMTDTPTNNFATLNPVALYASSDATISNGSLTVAYGSSATIAQTVGTIGVSSGKWYFEYTNTASSGANSTAIVGVSKDTFSAADYPGFDANGYGVYLSNGQKYNNLTGANYGATVANNAILQCALDLDNGKIYFGVNNQWANGSNAFNQVWASAVEAYSSLSGTFFPAIGDGSGGSTFTGSFNFGQRDFTYTPPTGYKALCTANLPTVSIQNPREHFGVRTYSGTAGSQSFTTDNNSFALPQADFGWIKHRGSATGQDHQLFDVLRSENLPLISNSTAAEGSAVSGFSLDAAGFTVPANTTKVSTTGESYVAWLWKANGAGSTNTQPANGASITSVYSANQTAGFSIVSYTGDGAASGTIYHGLNAVPKMIIVKNRDVTDSGAVYHAGTDTTLAKDYFLRLFAGAAGTDARSNTGAMWNDTAPTTALFSVGTEDDVNALNEKYIAYVFAEIPGFSKFGSYTGNGSTDGPYVHCGFRPRYIMIKNSASATDWHIRDTARVTYNDDRTSLFANLSSAEATDASYSIDITATGFKVRGSNAWTNGSGAAMIFAAFAEFPNGSNVAPAPAR